MIKSLNILFVEDEERIRELLKETIADEFNSFVTAIDGLDGIKKFKNGKFDLIISDISMPKMSGLDMVAEIKKISKNIPIILLSAYSDKEKLLQAIDIGVTKYLIKPIDPEELLETILKIKIENSSNNIVHLKNSYFFDLDKNLLYFKEHNIKLTKKELLFVTLLIKNRDKITPKEEIKLHIWNNQNADDTLLRTLVRRIRTKTNKDLVENFPAIGYKIA